MKRAFPEAIIWDFEGIIEQMSNAPKDRHVLVAAVHGKIPIIVTFNSNDFKPKDIEKWGVKAVHPQDLLVQLYRAYPKIVIQRFGEIAQKKNRPLEESVAFF